MQAQPTFLRSLLRARHLQSYPSFCREYDRVAAAVDRELVGHYPSRAQFFRWQSGELLGLPYPDHCRVLEAMFPGRVAAELFTAENDGPAANPTGDAATEQAGVLDITAAFATRSDFAAAMPVHRLLGGARDIRAVGLSLNQVCALYHESRLGRMVEDGTRLRCAFLQPDGTAMAQREREEGHPPGLLSDLTRTNIEALTRLRSRLTADAQERIELRTYDEVPRFNVLLVDGTTCVAQPYLPDSRGVDSPSLVLTRNPAAPGLFAVFEEVFETLWSRSSVL